MMKRILSIMIGLGFILQGSLAHAAVFAASESEQSIGSEFEFLFDPNEKFDFDTIQSADGPWIKSNEVAPNFAYKDGYTWARLHLKVEGVLPVYLEYRHPLVDEVVYRRMGDDHSVEVFKAGDHVARVDWPLKTRVPTFKIREQGEFWIYLRVRTHSTLHFYTTVFREEAYFEQQRRDDQLQTMFFGAILAIALYNLLVGLVTGVGAYVYYVVFLFGYAAFQAAMSGYIAYAFFPQGWTFVDIFPSLGMGIGMWGATVFTGRLLNLRALARWQRPIELYVLASCVLGIIAYVVGNAKFAVLLTMYTGVLPWIVYLITVCTLGLRSGEHIVRWYIAAWTCFIAGSIVTFLRVNDIVGTNVLTLYAQQLGSAIEFILLSFTLANRIKTLQENIQIEHEHALKAEIAAREADQRALRASEEALEEQKRLASIKDQFLANTSHELRTPLNGMIGLTQSLMARGGWDENDGRDLEKILSSSQRLSRLVGDILDFSSLNQGILEVDKSVLDLKGLLLEALDSQLAALKQKGLQLHFDVPEQPLWIQGDERCVGKVLRSILSNAIKFTEHGDVTVSVREGEAYLDIAIIDTGIGIPAERIKSLDSAFEQVDGSTTRKHGGTGLGLAMSARMMKSMEGQIKILTQKQLGTTVILSFLRGKVPVEMKVIAQPIVVKEAPVQKTGTESGVSFPATAKKLQIKASALSVVAGSAPSIQPNLAKILVVDDDEVNRLVLINFLLFGGYTVHEACDGVEALAKIEEIGPFDAILCDVMMPGMSGYDVCKELRKTHDSLSLPILLLTAMQQSENIVAGFEAGANDYLIKPIQKDELYSRLKTQLYLSRNTAVLKRFVPHDIISLLGYQDLHQVRLGDAVERDMIVMFADIRGFTGRLESSPPAEAFRWLNHCYAILGPVIRRHGGFIDKYIGDAILSLFAKDADAAIAAVVDMMTSLSALTRDYWIGIGLHCGPTIVGTLGEPERFEATVLSDTVNVASRIEGISKQLETPVLISADIYARLNDPARWHWRCIGPVGLKGRKAKLVLYELLDLADDLDLKRAHAQEFNEALHCFLQEDFQKAHLLFHALATVLPNDKLTALYAVKSREFAQDPSKFTGGLDFDSKD